MKSDPHISYTGYRLPQSSCHLLVNLFWLDLLNNSSCCTFTHVGRLRPTLFQNGMFVIYMYVELTISLALFSYREVLYEDKSFDYCELAALVASKVYYHLGAYEDSLTFALGAGWFINLDAGNKKYQ